jgi:hypothetical protein
MTFVLGTLILAALVGVAAGGRLARLATLRIRWVPVAVLALTLQAVSIPGRDWSLALLLASFGLLVAFAVRNLHDLPGFRLVLIGIVLNVFVIAVNGGMPVTREALDRSGQGGTLTSLLAGGTKHHLAGPDDRVLLLADSIPIAPLHQIVSVGDLFTYAGVAWLVIAGTLGRDRVRGRGAELGRVRLGEEAGV